MEKKPQLEAPILSFKKLISQVPPNLTTSLSSLATKEGKPTLIQSKLEIMDKKWKAN